MRGVLLDCGGSKFKLFVIVEGDGEVLELDGIIEGFGRGIWKGCWNCDEDELPGRVMMEVPCNIVLELVDCTDVKRGFLFVKKNFAPDKVSFEADRVDGLNG